MMRDDSMEQWRKQCRRQLQRDTLTRLKYGFVRTYKPILDDAKYRVYSSTAQYRAWCRTHLPAYLGYGEG
ncbi:MAG: hypothetical protein HY360_13495 [Verrucomicrobia bacterium]|nr:hypothetical protein [Verrucomicrobiota bacterium]